MKKIAKYYFLLIFSLAFILTSCRGECSCTNERGCLILTATRYTDNKVMERTVVCSTINYRKDHTFADSSYAFSQRHSSDQTRIFSVDSIYYYQRTDNIKPKETARYENLGYYCECYK